MAACAIKVPSFHDDEDLSVCGQAAVEEHLATSGEWEPICHRHRHYRGIPADRLRPIAPLPLDPSAPENRW